MKCSNGFHYVLVRIYYIRLDKGFCGYIQDTQILWFYSTGLLQMSIGNDAFVMGLSLEKKTIPITKHKTSKKKANISWPKRKFVCLYKYTLFCGHLWDWKGIIPSIYNAQFIWRPTLFIWIQGFH